MLALMKHSFNSVPAADSILESAKKLRPITDFMNRLIITYGHQVIKEIAEEEKTKLDRFLHETYPNDSRGKHRTP